MKQEQIKLYHELREARAKLEKKCDEIKAHEQAIKADILMELDKLGIDSFKEGGYTLSRKHNIRAEVTDHPILQDAMYALMTKAREEGRPLQDGLLLQRTVSKSSVIDLIRSRMGLREEDELDVMSEATQAEAAKLGIRLVDITDLTIRKS